MASRGRPKRKRLIHEKPVVRQFSPRGKPGRPDEILLGADECEALRLADLEGLNQTQSASYMCVSRPTFGRIVRRARSKVAEGLLKGKIIRIIP